MRSEAARGENWTICSERTLDGQTLQWYEKRDATVDAPALGFVHGMEENWDVWRDAAAQLSDCFRTFCMNLPWRGHDGYQWGHQRPAAEWLHEALQLMPTPPVALIAHSFGANALLDYLQRHQAPNLKAAILVSPFYKAQYEDLDWELFHDSLKAFREIMQRGLRIRQSINGRSKPALLAAMTDKVMDKVGPLGFIEFFALFSRTPALQLDRVTVPTLVVAGADDFTLTLTTNVGLAAALPEGEIELIPDCGHFCMLEQPEITVKLLRRFLAQHIGQGEMRL